MATVIRNRTISPDTRKESSKSYKVTTETVVSGDKLIVNIDHATASFSRQYAFSGNDVSHRKSISFRVHDYGTSIDITWSGAQPIEEIGSRASSQQKLTKDPKPKPQVPVDGMIESLAPIVNEECRVLTLGTMPGAESLRQQAYYAHPRNLFWKLITEVTGEQAPRDYEHRKSYLLKHKIAVWDMCEACIREGSLDANISEEMPNDIQKFVADHPSIKAIAFNGQTAAKIFAKHIGNITGIKLLSLPSTSPANAGVSWEEKVRQWKSIIK